MATEGMTANAASEAGKNTWQRFVGMVRKQGIRPRMYTSRAFGEVASLSAAPLVVAVVVNTSLNNPYQDLKNRIRKAWIEPNYDKIDHFLKSAKSIDPPFEREEREGLPLEEKAKKVTDLLVDNYGLKMGASIAAQFATQDFFTRYFHAPVSPRHNAVSIAVDRGVQIGAVIAMNTLAADQAVAAQNGLVKLFKRMGMSEEKAEEWANFNVNVGVPNIIAAVASAELLTHFAKKGRL